MSKYIMAETNKKTSHFQFKSLVKLCPLCLYNNTTPFLKRVHCSNCFWSNHVVTAKDFIKYCKNQNIDILCESQTLETERK